MITNTVDQVKMMDCITSGLDSATAYDIMKAIKLANEMLGLTNVTSLLQVSSHNGGSMACRSL